MIFYFIMKNRVMNKNKITILFKEYTHFFNFILGENRVRVEIPVMFGWFESNRISTAQY